MFNVLNVLVSPPPALRLGWESEVLLHHSVKMMTIERPIILSFVGGIRAVDNGRQAKGG